MSGWIPAPRSLRPPDPSERLELERDIEEELRFHLDMRAQDNQVAGMDAPAARTDALARFGDVAQIKAQCLHIQHNHPWHRVAEAVRSIGMLALGIGGVCVVFLVLNAVLFRPPLTYQGNHGWLAVWWQHENGTTTSISSRQDFLAWQQDQTVFDRITLAQYYSVNLASASGVPESGRVKRISTDYFAMHGVAPLLGRGFLPEEFAVGAPPVVVLSYDLWQRRYQGNYNVLDDTLLVDGTPHAIVGVMPADFQMYYKTDVFAPFTFAPGEAESARQYLVAGHLRAGLSLAAAEATLQTLHTADDPAWRVLLRPVGDVYGEAVRNQLFVYLGLMVLLLLLACIHVFRQHWSRIVLQQKIGGADTMAPIWLPPGLAGLIESLCVALAAGLLGLALARLFVNSLLGPLLGDFAHLFDIQLDTRVLGFALSLSLMLGLWMGLLPLVLFRQPAGTRQRTSNHLHGHRTEGILMALEIALALILVVTAGLMGRGVLDQHSAERSFDPDSVLVLSIPLAGSQYATSRTQSMYFGEVFNRLDTLDGVQAASLALALPGSEALPQVSIFLSKQAPTTQQQQIHLNVVGTDYLEMMDVPLRQGHLFKPEDARKTVGVTVINKAMAMHLWPSKEPVGQYFFLNNPGRDSVEVIGVVGDQNVIPVMYWLYWRVGGPAMHLVVKAETDPLTLAASVEKTLRSIDPQVPLESRGLISQILTEQARTDFLFVAVFVVLALIALAMAAVSIARSLTHTVHLRSREIGIRRLLGATSFEIQVLTLRPVLGRIFVGVALGLAGAALIMPFFVGLLFEGDPLDPMAYASAALLLAGALLVVACTSARKAAHLDPILALRYG